MGSSISGDVVLEDINNISNSVRFRRLYRTMKELVLFLGFWNATDNIPNILTMSNVAEDSVLKIINPSSSSVLGSCDKHDWIVYKNNQWSIVSIPSDSVDVRIKPLGVWNSLTNRPELSDSMGYSNVSYYISSNAVVNLGSGSFNVYSGDIIYYNSSSRKWQVYT